MKITITKIGLGDYKYQADDTDRPGSPPVGYGRSMIEAIGSFIHVNQKSLGIEFVVDESAMKDEETRRLLELSKR